MAQVVILVDAETDRDRSASIYLSRAIAALEQAILGDRKDAISAITPRHSIAVIAPQAVPQSLDSQSLEFDPAWRSPETIVCPLTIHVPANLPFPGQAVYQTCRDIVGLRHWVAQHCNVVTGAGDLWLPIVLTAKGALYAEVIAADLSPDGAPEQQVYYQPLHLPDRWRQPLYALGQRLLSSLAAPPAVYMLQFSFQNSHLVFDRLLPFPSDPAIASLGVQTPDLFECHWRCLTQQPLLDVMISNQVAYRVYEQRATIVTLG